SASRAARESMSSRLRPRLRPRQAPIAANLSRHRVADIISVMSTPQLAFLGCAHIHTPGFIKTVQKRADLRVKSVWDHDPARGQMRADQLSARFFADYRAILDDPEID